jgi:hypothetical protein
MSTSTNLKKLLGEHSSKPTALSGVLASLGSISREALLEMVVVYYNGVDVEALHPPKQPPKGGKSRATEPATAKQGQTPTAMAKEFGIDFMFFNGLERLAFLLLAVTQDLHLDPETREPTNEQREAIGRAATELQNGRHRFRAAVKWLCSPKSSQPGLSPNRLARLLESGKLEWGRYPDIDQSSENFIKYFEDHGLKHFRIRPSLMENRLILSPRCVHFVDLLCAFLLHECSGKRTTEMPIKTCGQCGKLFWSPSKAAEFCSRDCQWNHYWTPERKRDDTYIKRLEEFVDNCTRQTHGFSRKDLGAKLTSHQVAKRLNLIEKRWIREWPKLATRVRAIQSAISEAKS